VVFEPFTVRAGLSVDMEVTITALVRARFCELAGQDRLDANGAEMFTLGLFSVIDALFDTAMTELLDKLPFAPDVREALVEHKGPKGQLIECLKALESDDLDKAEAILPTASDLYVSALTWAEEASEPPPGRWQDGRIARLSLAGTPVDDASPRSRRTAQIARG
jgi:c-di-GMP-related signal transduction protein